MKSMGFKDTASTVANILNQRVAQLRDEADRLTAHVDALRQRNKRLSNRLISHIACGFSVEQIKKMHNLLLDIQGYAEYMANPLPYDQGKDSLYRNMNHIAEKIRKGMTDINTTVTEITDGSVCITERSDDGLMFIHGYGATEDEARSNLEQNKQEFHDTLFDDCALPDDKEE